MVKFRISPIYPAIAAVLVAAAFVFMCLCPDNYVIASDTNTTTAAANILDSIYNNYPSLRQEQFDDNKTAISFSLCDWFGDLAGGYTGIIVGSCVDNGDSFDITGDCYYSHNGTITQVGTTLTLSTVGGNDGQGYVRLMSTAYQMPYNDYAPSVLSVTFPNAGEGAESIPLQRYYPIISGRISTTNNPIGSCAVAPVSGNIGSFVQNSANIVRQGNSSQTTTATTTTTTTTTTITTTVTLATFPYQTNPPFELPSDWLGDYSETVPVPSVPPVTTVDVSGYDEILTDAENNFVSAIGFWFLAMKDFLSLNPTITYLAVFTIAIVLIILLLYNRGDDD